MSGLPLAGRRVLVTRAAHQAGKLSNELRARGAEPVEVPVLEVCPPESYEPLDRALRQLGSYDWLILTSANTVQAIAERAAALGLVFAPLDSVKIAVVGTAPPLQHAPRDLLSRLFRRTMSPSRWWNRWLGRQLGKEFCWREQ